MSYLDYDKKDLLKIQSPLDTAFIALAGGDKIINFKPTKHTTIMGKGDKKTKRGKITMGTFGVRRPRKKTKPYVVVKKKATTTAKITEDKPKAATKAKPKAATKAKPKAATKAKPKEATKAKPKEATKAKPKEATKAKPKEAVKTKTTTKTKP